MVINVTLNNDKIILDVTKIDRESVSYLKNLRNLYDSSEELILDKQNEISISLINFLELYEELVSYSEKNKYQLILCSESALIIQNNLNNNSYYEDLEAQEIKIDEIQQNLIQNNWNSDRILTPHQLRNVAQLYRYNSSATFSVPGAGKTTEALALFCLKSKKESKLLVICPKNAFMAWDEGLKECLNTNEMFNRLTLSLEECKRLLSSNPKFSIINYDRMDNRWDYINILIDFCIKNEVTIFLDESHRIKNMAGMQSKTTLKLAPYAKEKLIMSGTPLPNKTIDLIAQFQFLYPNRLINESNIISSMNKVYVRTTKDELGLPDRILLNIPVPMSKSQKELHDMLIDEFKLEFSGFNSKTKITARKLRHVMKLLKICSNPQLLAEDSYTPKKFKLLFRDECAKMDKVCEIVRNNYMVGKKTLVWSTFRNNIDLLTLRLKDLGAEYIYGGVKTGDKNDPSTREYKINKFNNSSECNVLIANPAAASEGINLHTSCDHAVYMDRTFNAGQYLQSMDRIHRLGSISKKYITVLYHENSIDERIDKALKLKMANMQKVLNDKSIQPEIEMEDIMNNDSYDIDSSTDRFEDFFSKKDINFLVGELK